MGLAALDLGARHAALPVRVPVGERDGRPLARGLVGFANWREKGGAGWLSVFATAVAWGALTRPLTALAYAATGGVFVLLELARRRRPWRDLALACVPALAILSLLPIWTRNTTGSGEDPYRAWARSYLPVDRPGFGITTSAAPERELPRDMQVSLAVYTDIHARHRPEALVSIALGRAAQIGRDFWGGWRAPLVALFLIGLFVVPREGRFAVATALLLFVSHLVYAHDPGMVDLLRGGAAGARLGRRRPAASPRSRRSRDGASTMRPRRGRRTGPALASIALAVVALAPVTAAVAAARIQVDEWSVYHDHFRAELAAIPEPRAIVFVRYGPHHVVDMSLVRNSPDPTRAPVWIVYDRGQDNARLLRAAPGRAPYLYDAVTGTLAPWSAEVAP